MKITQTKSYPVRIWEEDIIEALNKLWIEELEKKLEEYKSQTPNKKITNYQYSESEFYNNGRIIKEMTISFDPVEIYE